MRAATLAVVVAAVAGCEMKGSVAPVGTGRTVPTDRRTDINIDAPGVKVDVQGRRPDGTGKRDIDVDVRRDRNN